MKLKDKVAIVTGGAMGNGLGIVKVFLKEGAKVAIFDSSEKLNDTVNSLVNEGYQVRGFNVDIRDKEKVEAFTKNIYEKYGSIDIVVNNAGVARLEKFEDMSDEVRDFHFDVNIKGTWNVTKAALPRSEERRVGKECRG